MKAPELAFMMMMFTKPKLPTAMTPATGSYAKLHGPMKSGYLAATPELFGFMATTLYS